MSKDRVIGGLILGLSLTGIVVYGWLLFFTELSMITLQVTAFIAVAGILGILAWIGYTLATTPPPKPIEEIEKELGEEFKSIKEESGEGKVEEPSS